LYALQGIPEFVPVKISQTNTFNINVLKASRRIVSKVCPTAQKYMADKKGMARGLPVSFHGRSTRGENYDQWAE
jgi:Holliday junction resolvase-like predicted endonuclease